MHNHCSCDVAGRGLELVQNCRKLSITVLVVVNPCMIGICPTGVVSDLENMITVRVLVGYNVIIIYISCMYRYIYIRICTYSICMIWLCEKMCVYSTISLANYHIPKSEPSMFEVYLHVHHIFPLMFSINALSK